MSLINVQNKRVVITGVNGQIGSAFARHFAAAGAEIFGVDVADRTQHDSGYARCNMAEPEAVAETFATINATMGGMDVLINNAGVAVFTPFDERTEDELNFVTNTNLKGPFYAIKEFVKYQPDADANAAIINIGSLYGIIAPDKRIYTDCARNSSEIYGATKAAVIQMTKYFAVELAQRGIRVNAISPGGIFNPDQPQGEDFVQNYSARCPMGRMARVDEMAGCAIYLASNAASYTTGQNIAIDGGLTCW